MPKKFNDLKFKNLIVFRYSKNKSEKLNIIYLTQFFEG